MPEPIAQTTSGKVRGIEKMGCLQFRGVPFTAPPLADRRWKPPQPHEGWDGERECTEFGPVCPQVAGGLEQLGGGQRRQNPMDEDCLTLNVFTPGIDDARRPVMLWIHGGAFSTGSGRLPWYYGHNFARDGVVCVTTNYRVSAFGFLHLEDHFGPEFRESGTLGTQDQIAALHWIRDNIAGFGGDPDNVTIFGESAGGMSVGTLLAAPGARGLFHQGIPQSGASHSSHTPQIASRVTERFLAEVGVAPGDADALGTLPVDRILEGVARLGLIIAEENADLFGEDFAGSAMPFQPVSGGDVLPRFPIDAVRDGSGAGTPLLVGTTLEEWKLFTLIAPADGVRVRAVRPLRNLCAASGRSVDELVSAYEHELSSPSELELRNAIETDRIFRIPAIRLAEAQVANETPAWMYRFDWRSTAFGGRLGACHALEIPFVFDNLSAPGVDVFTGGSAPQELATNMHAAWVAFAKTGDPNADGLPSWPAYDIGRRATMLLDAESRIEDDPGGDARRLWDGLL